MAETLLSPSSETEDSTSTTSPPLCTSCNLQHAIYTCPRCCARTCSLPCSSAHKTNSACSGVRNRAAYVPLKRYGWGTMVDDYAFLEDAGRRVGDWGREIVQGGLMAGGGQAGRGMERGRGRGRGGGRGGHSGGKTKRDVLRMQLGFRDIDMELLPLGMQRRKSNQSIWDFKNRIAFLTTEFKFYPPVVHSSLSQPQTSAFTLLTHRNSTNFSLISLLRNHISGRANSKKESSVPTWVKSLVLPDAEDPEGFTLPECFIATQLDPTSETYARGFKKGYHKLDASENLGAALRNTHFVEFPTIEVWEESVFRGTIVDKEGTITKYEVKGDRPTKRRKMDEKAGKKTIVGLVGGYGSEEEEENTALTLLDAYEGSDEDGEIREEIPDQLYRDDSVLHTGDTDDEETCTNPAVLLELLKNAGGFAEEEYTESSGGEDLDDRVDWGDSPDDDVPDD